MTVLPGPIRQIGYVVTDLDQAMAGWVELGVGPWLVMRGLPMQALYRGEPCETSLSVAWSNSGELQITVPPGRRTNVRFRLGLSEHPREALEHDSVAYRR